MSTLRINESDWLRIKNGLQKEYPELTESDLTFRKGEEEALIGRIESRLSGVRRTRIIDRIKTL